MKQLGQLIEKIMWTLFIAACAFIVIVVLIKMSDGDYVDVPTYEVVACGGSSGSYNTAIDGNQGEYIQVQAMLANDSIMDIHWFCGIDTIYDHEWEETANALGIKVDDLTIDQYMKELQRAWRLRWNRERRKSWERQQ